MVEYVRDKHSGESVVLVTHMDPIKAAVSYAISLNLTICPELFSKTNSGQKNAL